MTFQTPRSLPRITTPAEYMLALADPPGRHYKANPVAWARERAGVELWSKQQDIIHSVRDNRLTAVHSCHEAGKSYTAAMTVAWWLDVHEPGEAFAVTTAPTGPQVEAILWREINRIHKRAGLLGRTNLTEWYIGRELVAFGRKPSDYNPHAFQGLHARYMLVVLDEACGVVPVMWTAASTLTANENSRVLAIGNPDDRNTEFGDNCLRGDDWNVIGVGYKDTPNFTKEPVSPLVAESLIHEEWVEERRRKWGEGSALFQSKCEGKFPDVGDPYACVPFAWANACRYLEYPAVGDREGGIDVGAGGDRTVLTVRQGNVLLEQLEFVDADPMRTVARLARAVKDNKLKRVKIDVAGIGWGIYGRLKELSSVNNPTSPDTVHDAEVIDVNFGAGPPVGYEKKFLNMRAYVHWEIGREYSRLKRWDLSRADDDLIHELTTPRYEILDSYHKIKIEPKDKVKERTGASPDKSDSLLIAFYEVRHELSMPTTESLGEDLLKNTHPRDLTTITARAGWAGRADPLGERPF